MPCTPPPGPPHHLSGEKREQDEGLGCSPARPGPGASLAGVPEWVYVYVSPFLPVLRFHLSPPKRSPTRTSVRNSVPETCTGAATPTNGWSPLPQKSQMITVLSRGSGASMNSGWSVVLLGLCEQMQ